MNYPLFRRTQNNPNSLRASHGYYSDEYAHRMFDLHLKDELARGEDGKVKKFYRLYARNNHTPEMALAYDIGCPDCGRTLKQVGRQLTFNELGLYECQSCNK